MNWDDIRFFLAVYRCNTLGKASDELNVDQTTIGRRIKALEKVVGQNLFVKSPLGYTLTNEGENLLNDTLAMENAAHSIKRKMHTSDLEGIVRLTTTDGLALDFINKVIVEVQQLYPKICIELSISISTLDVNLNETDIAIRTIRPNSPNVKTKRLAQWNVGLFASEHYISTHGYPNDNDNFKNHNVVIYQPGITHKQNETLVGKCRNNAHIIAQVNSSAILKDLIEQGAGIGELPIYYQKESSNLVRLFPQNSRNDDLFVWLVVHPDLTSVPRVRAVIDTIERIFSLAEHQATLF
ncbi:LysR family transcriptional regulator [Aliivibrio wodanis]|uniref:LysR family transcriptional regulator n=1 Tax=Aliivibrio wodanis TaxID=80852 RepID=UPI00406D1884